MTDERSGIGHGIKSRGRGTEKPSIFYPSLVAAFSISLSSRLWPAVVTDHWPTGGSRICMCVCGNSDSHALESHSEITIRVICCLLVGNVRLSMRMALIVCPKLAQDNPTNQILSLTRQIHFIVAKCCQRFISHNNLCKQYIANQWGQSQFLSASPDLTLDYGVTLMAAPNFSLSLSWTAIMMSPH